MSIRHLELTPNTSESSFRLSPQPQLKKQSKDSVDSGCQNEAIQSNCENFQNDCDCDITNYNSRNVRKMDTLDLTINCRQSSSSTLSDASSCGINRTIMNDQRKRESQKYHSVVRNRQRKDTLVARSKSFQEQDIKLTSNARFNLLRRQNRKNNNFDQQTVNEIISHHNIEITIEDMDADVQQPNNETNQLLNDRTPSRGSSKLSQNECSSLNSSELNGERSSKTRSGHILGRIFRRMRKLSMVWRNSKNKSRTRGDC